MAIHTLEQIVAGASSFKGIANLRFGPAYQAELNAGGSELDATKRSIVAGEPVITFDCLDIDAALRLLFNTAGTAYMIPYKAVSAGATSQVYLQSLDDGVTRGAAGSNIIFKSTKGVFVPIRAVGSGSLAVLTVGLYLDYDGTNVPVQKLTSQNLAGTGSGAAALSRGMEVKNGTTVLQRIGVWSVDFGIQVSRPLSRDLYPPDALIVRYAPSATWTTADLEGALTAAGFASAAAAVGGLQLILAKYDSDDVFVETTGAIALTFRQTSRIVPVMLNFGAGGIASISYGVTGRGNTAYSVAADAPMTLSTGITVDPEPDPPTARSFMIGPVYNGASKIDLRDGLVDFGLMVDALGPQNLPWPTKILVTGRAPGMGLTVDASADYTGVAEGAAIHADGLCAFLRALGSDGLPLADASAEHLQVLFPVGWIGPEDVAADHNTRAAMNLRVSAVKGAGAMMTVNQNVAIAALP